MGFGFPPDVASYQRITTSGLIGDSGKPIDIVGYSINSGATAGVATFRNGPTSGAAVAWADTAVTVSAERTITLAFPVRLNGGCYMSIDGNITALTVFYRQMYT